jgi:hypothetical protein
MGKGQSKAKGENDDDDNDDVVSPLPKRLPPQKNSKRRLAGDTTPLEELDPTSPKLSFATYASKERGKRANERQGRGRERQ